MMNLINTLLVNGTHLQEASPIFLF